MAPQTVRTTLADLLFVDVEASGLHATSYPIEIGWCDLSGRTESYLLRRQPDWTDEDWTQEAEVLHGISRGDLACQGLPVTVVATSLDTARLGRHLVSDAPMRDMAWTTQMLLAAGRTSVPRFASLGQVLEETARLAGLSDRLRQELQDLVTEGVSDVHRAGADARGMAEMVSAFGLPASSPITLSYEDIR